MSKVYAPEGWPAPPAPEKKKRTDPDASLHREGVPTVNVENMHAEFSKAEASAMQFMNRKRVLEQIAAGCRELLTTIDLWTDCMDGTVSVERIYDHVDYLEDLLKEIGMAAEQKDEVQP